MTDIQRAMLGDHEAAKRLTEQGVLIPCACCNGKGKIMARQHSFHGQNFAGNKKLSWQIYIKCTRCHARSTPQKTEPIKLCSDTGWIQSGNFYATEWWRGKGKGLKAANEAFAKYVHKAIEAWNTRAPLLTPEQIDMLERMESNEENSHTV